MSPSPPSATDALEHRDGLPIAFRYLEADCPRAKWPVMDLHPMASHWLEIHGWFRGQMDELGKLGGLWREGQIGAADYRAHATPRLRHLLNNLHHHHTLETEHAFPQLAAADPRMVAGFELLDRDHDDIEHLLAAMAEAANGLIRAGGEPGEMPPLAHTLADRIERGVTLIVRHLGDEEEIVVPVLTLSGHDFRL